MRTRSLDLSKFTIPLSFWHTLSISNIVRIKMPLKYRMCIQFASCCNCTSVVILLDFFIDFFSTRDTLSVFLWSETNTAAYHSAIMTLQFFQLMLRRFVIVYCLGDSRRATDPMTAPMIDPRMPNSDRTDMTPLRFTRKYSLVLLFLVFKPIPIFVLAIITAQIAVAAAFSLKVESPAVMRFRAFSVSVLSAACRSTRLLLYEYTMLCSRYAVSNELIPLSPLSIASLITFPDHKTDIWEYSRKEDHLSHDLTSLSMRFAAIFIKGLRPICIWFDKSYKSYCFIHRRYCHTSESARICLDNLSQQQIYAIFKLPQDNFRYVFQFFWD